MHIAVIPARGGSKRIPRKNIREFCGKPIIVWSIEAALESGCYDQVIISTDDDEIATVARRHGAEVPFTRPAELADDHTGTRAVIQHATAWFEAHIAPVDYVSCIYATAPFVHPEDLRKAFETLTSNPALDCVISAAPFPAPVQRAYRMTADGMLQMLHPEHRYTRSQDLEEAYHDAGQFYVWRANALLMESERTQNRGAIVLARYRVQDIDTPEDWRTAELLFQFVRTMNEDDRYL